MSKIKLGDKVRDTITGFKGIAIGCTTWLNGCDRIIVQPQGVNKEGKTFENQSFDEPDLEVIKTKKVKEGKHSTGGWKPEVKQKTFNQ